MAHPSTADEISCRVGKRRFPSAKADSPHKWFSRCQNDIKQFTVMVLPRRMEVNHFLHCVPHTGGRASLSFYRRIKAESF